MLYLDSSALVKKYVQEIGTENLLARLGRGDHVFTSALSYAEVLAALANKFRAHELKESALEKASEEFLHDWIFTLNVLEVDSKTMNAVRNLVRKHPLKGADAAQLSTAMWLQDSTLLVPDFSAAEVQLEFVVADIQLARIASRCGLRVFNPEAATPGR